MKSTVNGHGSFCAMAVREFATGHLLFRRPCLGGFLDPSIWHTMVSHVRLELEGEVMAGTSTWDRVSVFRNLKTETPPGQLATVQVFLHPSVRPQDIDMIAREIIGGTGAATLRKIHPSARSFSVRAPVEILEKITEHPDIKSVLPSMISDVYPRPISM